MMDITLPEVISFDQNARFYREGEKDFIEISFVGMKDTVVKKVTPELMARFREEWDSYCDGRPMSKRPGTPLTDLPGINDQLAKHYIDRNVHVIEELAVLSDAQCQGLGHGTLTLRKKAAEHVANKRLEESTNLRNRVADQQAKVGAAPEVKTAAIEASLAELSGKFDLLLGALGKLVEEKRGPGRPKGKKNGANNSS